jgi:hypothetical protein
MSKFVLFGALFVAVFTRAATEASFEMEPADTGLLWPFDAVGAWFGRHIRETFSSAHKDLHPADVASTQDFAAIESQRARTTHLDTTDVSRVSMPKDYWVNDIDEDGIINVKLNSQLQVMPGMVTSEGGPTTSSSSLLEYFPFEAIGSLFRKLQGTSKVQGFLAKDLPLTKDSSVPKVEHADHRNESGVIEVKLESELQTGDGSPTPSLLQFWPLEAITSLFRGLVSKPDEKPLDLPELVATKNTFTGIKKRDRTNDINETGILVVRLSSELQIDETTGVASKNGSIIDVPLSSELQTNETTAVAQDPAVAETVAITRYSRVLVVLACSLFVGCLQLVNYCGGVPLGVERDIEKLCDAASERLLTPRRAGQARSLRSPRILPSPRALKSPRINPEYGACAPNPPNRQTYKRPEAPKRGGVMAILRESKDEDLQAIRGGF